MVRVKGRMKAQELFFFVTAVLLAAFFIGAAEMQLRFVTAFQAAATALGFAAIIALTPCLARLAGRIRYQWPGGCRGEILRLALLLLLALLPRLAWWTGVPPRIESDYELYVRMGTVYAETGQPEMSRYLLTIAPNAVQYSVYTGLLMRVFGASAGTLVTAAAVMHVCSILLLYGVGRTLAPARRAFAAAAVFALLPENVFYSNTPGIEAPAMFTILLGLLLITGGKSCRPVVRRLLRLCGGAVLAFSASIRPNAWAALIAAAIWLVRTDKNAYHFGRRLLRLVPLLIGTAAVFFSLQAMKNQLFAEQKPVSGLGWSLYEGLDLENGGKWTPEKSARCIEVINAFEPEEADRIFMEEGLERYRGYSLPEKALLFVRKGGSLWYETRYSVFAAEGTAAYEDLDHIARTAWAACIAACIFGLLYRFRHRLRGEAYAAAGMPLAVILLTNAWHEIGTSIGRYHYMMIPFLLLLAAVILPGRAELVQSERRPEA